MQLVILVGKVNETLNVNSMIQQGQFNLHWIIEFLDLSFQHCQSKLG